MGTQVSDKIMSQLTQLFSKEYLTKVLIIDHKFIMHLFMHYFIYKTTLHSHL